MDARVWKLEIYLIIFCSLKTKSPISIDCCIMHSPVYKDLSGDLVYLIQTDF